MIRFRLRRNSRQMRYLAVTRNYTYMYIDVILQKKGRLKEHFISCIEIIAIIMLDAEEERTLAVVI